MSARHIRIAPCCAHPDCPASLTAAAALLATGPGHTRLATWLAGRHVKGADAVAREAIKAAQAQHAVLPGQDVAARIVAEPAGQILAWTNASSGSTRRSPKPSAAAPQAKTIESLPGMGPTLGAEFVVAAGDPTAYQDADHLASAAGLCPCPVTRPPHRQLHRPKRCSRRLRRVFYLPARSSMMPDGPNRDYYLKKRGEGCTHVQAVIALARRRTNLPAVAR